MGFSAEFQLERRGEIRAFFEGKWPSWPPKPKIFSGWLAELAAPCGASWACRALIRRSYPQKSQALRALLTLHFYTEKCYTLWEHDPKSLQQERSRPRSGLCALSPVSLVSAL